MEFEKLKKIIAEVLNVDPDEITMEKILRGRIIKLYEDDEELLEDVLIEIRQAVEMCLLFGCLNIIRKILYFIVLQMNVVRHIMGLA